MGSHESKSVDDLFIGTDGLEENLLDFIQSNDSNTREEDEQQFINEVQETVIPDQNHTSVAMNEIDSHNLLSSESIKNKVTVLALNRSEPSDEIDHSIPNVISAFNKGVKIESDLNQIEFNVDTHNPSNTNKSVELYKKGRIDVKCDPATQLENSNLPVCDEISSLKTNAINSDDQIQVIKIKRESLTEEYNLHDDDSGTQLETSYQGPLTTVPNSERTKFNANSIVEVNDLLADNYYSKENLNLIQKLNTHANELVNTDDHMLINENDIEILNNAQSFLAANSNFLTENCKADDLVISTSLVLENNRQNCVGDNLTISAKELYPQNNTLLFNNICDKLVNTEKPSKEINIKPIELPTHDYLDTNIKESQTVCDNEKFMIIEKGSFRKTTVLNENNNKHILCSEETIKKIKIEQIELANNEIPKTTHIESAEVCGIGTLNITENSSSPKSTVSVKNVNEDILITEDSHKKIKIEFVDENSISHLNSYKDNLNDELSNKTIKIERIELANNETLKTSHIEVAEVFDTLHFNTDNINENVLNIEEANRKLQIKQIELANIESPKTIDIASADVNDALHFNTNNENILLIDNINEDILNIDDPIRKFQIAQIQLANSETPKTTGKESAAVCHIENLNNIGKGFSQKDTVLDENITGNILNREETKKNLKIEQIELCENNGHLNIIEKKVSPKTTGLGRNIHDDILSNEVSNKKIKIIQLNTDDNSNTNEVDHDIKTAEVCENKHLNNIKEQLAPKSTLIENINETPFKGIKIEPIIIDVDGNFNDNIGNAHEESAEDFSGDNRNIGFKDTDKESYTNHSCTTTFFLNGNIIGKPPNIEDLSKEIKIDSSEVNVVEKSNEQSTKYNFVRNPFAFLKNLYKPTEKQPNNIQPAEKFTLANKLIQDEIIINDSDDELEITDSSIAVVKNEKGTDVPEKFLEIEEIPIKIFENNSNTNNVHIKREQIENSLENNYSPYCDKNDEDILNVSLDVNVDNLSTSDVDENLFSHSANDLLSNSTRITSPTSSEYYSVKDLSSLDDFKLSDPKSNVPTTDHKPTKLQRKWRGRPKGSGDLKPRKHEIPARKSNEKTKSQSYPKNIATSKSIKTKPKKIQKYSEKDSVFSPKHITKKYCVKTLPKIDIVTSTKKIKKVFKNSSKKKITPTLLKNNKEKFVNEDFPKPFKLEMTSNDGKNIATELPQPIVYKMESSQVTPAYNTRQFQPHVRLKRLKSPELLIPLKIRKISKNKKPPKPLTTKSNITENQQDFQIQQAFSLNPRFKYQRWSMDQDSPFENNSRVTTPSESKFFTPQELFTLFQSSTPNASARLSGQVNSGGSNSELTSENYREKHNRTLLLEIAAERAFINNHLLHFGFSPIHFELFNDLNDLNVFLKYLFGHLNSH